MPAGALVERVVKMPSVLFDRCLRSCLVVAAAALRKDSAPEGLRKVNGFEDGDVYPGQSIR